MRAATFAFVAVKAVTLARGSKRPRPYTAVVQFFSFRGTSPMNFRKLLCVVSLVGVAAVTVSAQTLPEIAKAEKERRAKLRAQGGTAKVYTESDRNSGTTVPATEVTVPAAATSTDPAAAASKKKEKTPEDLAAEKQKEWNDRLKAAQDEIKQAEDDIARNERNLSAMINITPARADLANRIEADKKKLATLKQTLLSLEDERRRAGMPRPR
jgi:phage terminase small subunit